jgi:hypothetical protein
MEEPWILESLQNYKHRVKLNNTNQISKKKRRERRDKKF